MIWLGEKIFPKIWRAWRYRQENVCSKTIYKKTCKPVKKPTYTKKLWNFKQKSKYRNELPISHPKAKLAEDSKYEGKSNVSNQNFKVFLIISIRRWPLSKA